MPRQKGGQKSFSAVCKCVYYQFSIAAASRLVTVVMSDPGPRLPSRMRLSGSEHAVVYRHGRDKDLFSALIFNTIFVAVSNILPFDGCSNKSLCKSESYMHKVTSLCCRIYI